MIKKYRCIHCGEWFNVDLDEDANYGSEPDCCDECLGNINVPEDYPIYDSDSGL